jgi:transglycosylase
LAAALEHGIPISKHYYAGSPMDFTGETFQGCKGKVRSGPFSVSNSTGHSGTMGLRTAAAYSVNTYFVQLERDAGLCNVTKMAKKTGVELASGKDIVKEYGAIPSFTLGTAYVTPLSMASSYAAFAARGVHCDPVIVKSIKNKDGQNLKVPDANCKRVMSTQVADGVNEVLKGVMNGTGAPARIPGGYPQAGKTGTTDSNEAVWFTGYTPAVAGAAFIAADSSSEHFRGREVRSIRGLHMSTGKYLKGSGGGDAGQIYRKAMAATLMGKPRTSFSEATDEIQHGKKVPVPSTSGMNYDEAKKALKDAGFDTRTKRVHSEKPEGTFLGADPDGGKAPQGSTIDLRVSSGPRPTYQRRAPQRDRWQQWRQQQQPEQQQQDPWQQQQQQPAPAEPPRYTQQPR